MLGRIHLWLVVLVWLVWAWRRRETLVAIWRRRGRGRIEDGERMSRNWMVELGHSRKQ